MRQLVLGLGLAVAISGCSAAKSAMSALSPKPPSVTVMTNVSTAPAPTADKPAAKKRGFFEKVGIVTTTTIVGAGLGALAGDALDADVGTAALAGAVAGGVTGAAIVTD